MRKAPRVAQAAVAQEAAVAPEVVAQAPEAEAELELAGESAPVEALAQLAALELAAVSALAQVGAWVSAPGRAQAGTSGRQADQPLRPHKVR